MEFISFNLTWAEYNTRMILYQNGLHQFDVIGVRRERIILLLTNSSKSKKANLSFFKPNLLSISNMDTLDVRIIHKLTGLLQPLFSLCRLYQPRSSTHCFFFSCQ
jgi:hypothetical protein